MTGQAAKLFEMRSLFEAKKPVEESNIFTFSSGKGGTGKTFISLNIAYQLSATGSKTLFIDLDLTFPNAHLLLNLIPHKTITSYFNGNSLLQDVISHYADNLDIIYGGQGIRELQINDFNILSSKIEELSANYDYVIIDTGAGADKKALRVISHANANIVVLSPEPTSVMDAYMLLKILNSGERYFSNYCLVNKAFTEEEGETAFNNLDSASSHFLKRNLICLGIIPFEPAVISSIQKQSLYLQGSVSSPAAELLKDTASRLAKFRQMANIHQ